MDINIFGKVARPLCKVAPKLMQTEQGTILWPIRGEVKQGHHRDPKTIILHSRNQHQIKQMVQHSTTVAGSVGVGIIF